MQCAILPREKVILWQDCITWWEFSLCKVDDIQTGHFLPPSYLFKQTPNSLLICTWILKIKLEKSSSTNWIFSLQSISKLIFAGYTTSKNQVPNRVKIQLVELDFSEIKYRSTGVQFSDCHSNEILQEFIWFLLFLKMLGSIKQIAE